MSAQAKPFSNFAPVIGQPSDLRRRITEAYRIAEPEAVQSLLAAAEADWAMSQSIQATARALIEALRQKGRRGGVEGLVKEYSLSSQEGVALMCLAEALLRVPDNDTRNALIRDKIAGGDWRAHVSDSKPLFVNAATWGLVLTGKLTGSYGETGLAAALTRLLARAGEPIIRRGVDTAMQLMGEQFVTGENISEALKRARRLEAQGFSYSYDMLGEAATTMLDADRYYADYEQAIHAIGKASAGRGIYSGPGISIKLSALHPRYVRSQVGRVINELLPRVHALAVLAKQYDIGFNIDAEEADRLELSLDLLENLALSPRLAGWNGLGCVVQAYGKRCPFVIDWLADLASRSGRRIMVRLVKGAYWDSEIKRAQVDGLSDFPVFTRKVHTDVSYIACARKLLCFRDLLFPQFATHNAQTLASIYHFAGPSFSLGDYEFQCLHGMGEPLYDEVVGRSKLDRPCRIYAPVGTHETLLAYLVRRLLENGANSSFVNRIWDQRLSAEDLARDPVQEAHLINPIGAPHPIVAMPAGIYPGRKNSFGLDLSSETTLANLSHKLLVSAATAWSAQPMIPGLKANHSAQPVLNPADHRDCVGYVVMASERVAQHSARVAADAALRWGRTTAEERAEMLELAADLLEAEMEVLLGLLIREAGKTVTNAVAEVREAVDFLRFYAHQARSTLKSDNRPLGPVLCISPWNFPLAIFIGQVAAALAAGNSVLAKPAEETPLIAAAAVRLLHAAGVPTDVLQLVPGDGKIGSALVNCPEVAGVLFTGSTEVAKLIQSSLSQRTLSDGHPIPLVAETGGQNAMIVDSSALTEQVTLDVIASAFDSAGQRCSALRILCLQEDIADRQLAMLKGAMAQLSVGNPDQLATDIGPVITAEARALIEAHVDRMRDLGCVVHRVPLSDDTHHGTFVAPTIIEVEAIPQIGREVFGPILHIIRFKRENMTQLIDAINATGYGLTFGLHTRLDETIAAVTGRVAAGNIYVNRNIVGAVVGSQPFGGRGLSGTGPKAGGELYLGRLVKSMPLAVHCQAETTDTSCASLIAFLENHGMPSVAQQVRDAALLQVVGFAKELPGPVGELNRYQLQPRGRVLLLPATVEGLALQLGTALASGNDAAVVCSAELMVGFAELLPLLERRVNWLSRLPEDGCHFSAVLVEPGADDGQEIVCRLARIQGPIPIIQLADTAGKYRPDWLVEEVSISINTTAAGGNAGLLALV